ncbi:LysR family transcriptional regulator [Serratia entomophila]|uniref:LysR substrate-binding domain-containing protein n=1 Tax=Serratia entomophila TaxID=42906 RepID=UPI002177730A|nr:LysR family transcriptional regulator [Serratia entomophila]CAI1119032.1 D-malate degradation protein R [Serratia entomophila]CAI1120193.1 D-malate degradation protein R [Serratia entomophila]CAI1123669.1 D-malate degradation protein R [Serratia entomophila]CAI1947923.1 D-malate degradation protein R [Serratia entomophila]CAI1950763.1 D-malate degradation protein R [Serratia entomophila]
MDRFNQYRIFVQVAEMGSFIKAANTLEIPRASVSAAVQQLEAQLGVRLLHRTTRQVRLTADGEQLIERLRPLLAEVEDIDQSFQTSQRQAAGRLSINVPSRIARRLIAPALPGLLRRHPHLQLVLGSADRAIDLVQEGVDCAVRVGDLHDSSLVMRALGHIALINCASPAYLNEYGHPVHPADLADGHWSVGYASPKTGRECPWEYLTTDGHTHRLDLPSQVVVNNAESYIACCLAGLGLIQIPRFDVQHLLDAGELLEVMPGYRAASMPVALIYPHRRQRSRRLAVFHAWFESLIQPHLER